MTEKLNDLKKGEMKLKEKIKLIKNWNLNAVPPNNIQWLDNATDKEIQDEWKYWTQEENPYEKEKQND
jgi:hypothetical protein